MTWRVITSKTANKQIRRLDKATLKKFDKAIMQLRENPFRTKTERLVNHSYADFRHRIGDHRILFDIPEKGIIQILYVWHRGKSYRK